MYKVIRSNNFDWFYVLIIALLVWAPSAQADPDKDPPATKQEISDLNKDRVVDAADLEIFGSKYLQDDWVMIDWCAFYDSTVLGVSFDSQMNKSGTNKGKPTDYYKKHFKLLLTFINDDYACDADPEPDPNLLPIENRPRLLVRMNNSNDGSGDIYITDPLVGSLFIYDENLVMKGELKDLSRPLGVAADSNGYILIGNDGRDNIEVYDPANGNLVAIFGEGLIIMPNTITTGPNGHIYVTDSRAHRVWVFDADYNFIRNIGSPGMGENELYFPVDTEVIERYVDGYPVTEVFIADQGNDRIQIFDTEGNFLRRIGPGECSSGGCEPPLMINLQALDVDALGRLHVLDNFCAVVTMLDPVTGGYLGEYGEYGEGPGYLRVPLGIVILDTGESVVTSGDVGRLEVFFPR